MRRTITFAVLFLVLFHDNVSQGEVIKCDRTTPICECTSPTDGICEFKLSVEILLTFTRYALDDGDSRGTAGRVWYINNNGTWEPRPGGSTAPCGDDIPIGDNRCSDPYGVDGHTFRSFIAVNGRIPGPTLIVPKHVLVKVNVFNGLISESISIHWHGQHQKNSNWMDGVEALTQCGILPGASFTYIFNATQHGTHWYHSHSGSQRTDGLFGSLIVREQDDTAINDILSSDVVARNGAEYQDLPGEHTLNFLEWQSSSSLDIFIKSHSFVGLFNVHEASKLPPDTPESVGTFYRSVLVNGRGSYSADRSNSILSTFRVEPSKIYRFRLIGAQTEFAYRVSIDYHKLIVIATDGALVNPVEVDYIIVHAGERYDFLIKTDHPTLTTFAIRGIVIQRTNKALLGLTVAEAILYYSSTNDDEPTSPMYEEILGTREAGVDPDKRRVPCSLDNMCKALNCPFRNFPLSDYTECLHISPDLTLHQSEYTDQLPDVATNDKLFLNFAFEGPLQLSAVNGRKFRLPSGPLAVIDNDRLTDVQNNEYCKGLQSNDTCNYNNIDGPVSTAPQCTCTHVRNVENDRSVQLVISAVTANPRLWLAEHPIHLHGHYFHVVDIQFGQSSPGTITGSNTDINCGGDLICNNPSWADGKDYAMGKSGKINASSPLKDTLIIPAGGYAVVYVKTDNPGWWLLHCHVEPHLLEGMGVILNVGGEDSKTPAPHTMDKCGNFSFTVDDYNRATTNTLNPSATTDDDNGSDHRSATIGLGIVAGIELIVIISCIIAIIVLLIRSCK